MLDDSTETIEQVHPNAATIAGLREVADWLEAHPELPEAYYAAACFRSAYAEKNAREELSTLAVALGDRAIETPGPAAGQVEIWAKFSGVRVSGGAQVQHLRDQAPIEPDYVPILPVIA